MAAKRKRTNENAATKPHANKKSKPSDKKQTSANQKKAPAAKESVDVVPNSNWAALKNRIVQKDKRHQNHQKEDGQKKKNDLDVAAHKQKLKDQQRAKRLEAKTANWIDKSLIVAMDCEMVGVGSSGKTSVLARCSIVDFEGNVLYDKNVRPVEKVTDFRTHVSGIRSRSLKNAIPFAQCLKEIGKLLKDKIIVGHALKNDFKALMFTPPKQMIRDTAKYRPYMRRKMNGTRLYPKSLKVLANEVLGLEIQKGEHDSVEDARAALALYKREQFAWEKYLRINKTGGSLAGIAPALPSHAKVNKPSANGKDADEGSSDDDNDDDDDEEDIAALVASGNKKNAKNVHVPDTKELAIMEYGE